MSKYHMCKMEADIKHLKMSNVYACLFINHMRAQTLAETNSSHLGSHLGNYHNFDILSIRFFFVISKQW